ncbi:MAG: hypothetical protein ACRDHM_07480 [Actinomycetota bacterium]
MMRGVGEWRCESCRRIFGGRVTFEKHRLRDRCLSVAELRRRGMHRRPEGTWVRADPTRTIRQLRLFGIGRPRKRRAVDLDPDIGKTAEGVEKATPDLLPAAADQRGTAA